MNSAGITSATKTTLVPHTLYAGVMSDFGYVLSFERLLVGKQIVTFHAVWQKYQFDSGLPLEQ